MRHLKRYGQLFENTQELTQEQKDWLDKCTKYGNWGINPQTGLKYGSWGINPQTGLVYINGDFDCSYMGLEDFKGVRFGQVSGNFNCSKNSLTSLEGAPQSVGRSFGCSHNDLKSLEGAPQRVGGNFFCDDNELKSLGLPDGFKVDGVFSCSHNKLTSLEGAPQSVGVDFYCDDNPISERAIKGVVKRMRDKKISLEQAVAEYWRNISREDRVYLAKHHPTLSEKDKKIYRAIELNMKRR